MSYDLDVVINTLQKELKTRGIDIDNTSSSPKLNNFIRTHLNNKIIYLYINDIWINSDNIVVISVKYFNKNIWEENIINCSTYHRQNNLMAVR